MTLSKSSLYMDKRHSISRTFSWLPSPTINSTKEDRQRTSVPFLNTHMNFTSPSLTLSPSTTSSPNTTATKKLGLFSKFKSSSTELDQVLSSSDEEEEEHHLPPTPRDSQQLSPSSSSPSPIVLTSSSSSVTLPAMSSSSSSQPPTTTISTRTRALTAAPILTTNLMNKEQDSITSSLSLTNRSPPPHPPQHASLNQYIQNVLASTFDDVDKTIEMEWDQERRRLEIDLLTPAPFQYS